MSTQKKILIINTGGTFNKVYDPIQGKLVIDQGSKALDALSAKSFLSLKIINLLGKDSLEIDNYDRLELLATISQSEYSDIIIVHGTDSMSETASYIADADLEKNIVFTGAMVPFSIDPVEATANFMYALGTIQQQNDNGVYIAIHGLFDNYRKIKKDRKKGRFVHV